MTGPLFPDDLRAEPDGLKARKTQKDKLLLGSQARRVRMTFLQPIAAAPAANRRPARPLNARPPPPN